MGMFLGAAYPASQMAKAKLHYGHESYKGESLATHFVALFSCCAEAVAELQPHKRYPREPIGSWVLSYFFRPVGLAPAV